MPNGSHFHLCPRRACGHIWSHAGRDIPEGGSRAAHTCPKCGKATDYWAKWTLREALCERGLGWFRRNLFLFARLLVDKLRP